MQAYPIRGSMFKNIMLLKGLPTENIQVLKKDLTFQDITTIEYNDCLLLTNGPINGGYALINSLNSNEYLIYDKSTQSFLFSPEATPMPLLSSSAGKQWNNLLAGVIYKLHDIQIRFLPSLLYEGSSLVEYREQSVLDIEKNINTLNDPTTFYFTNTLDARENILYKYSYGATCKTFSKGYCSSLTPYTGSTDYTTFGACYNTSRGFECYSEDFDKIKQDNGKITVFVVFLIFGLALIFLIIAFRIIETKTSSVFRPEIYFDDNNIIDIDDWH